MSESAPTVGERLKAERERRGMSAQKVADEMHLDVWVIDALEAGDYQRIGPSVYARGHLKKYASILGLSPELIAAGSEAKSAAAVAPAPTVVMHVPRATPAPIRAPWPQIASLILVIGAVGAVVWYRPWRHLAAPARPAARVAAAQAAAPLSTAARAGSGGASSSDTANHEAASSAAESMPFSSSDASAGGTPSSEDTAQRAPVSAPSPAPKGTEDAAGAAASLPGAGPARLRLSFSADSWVEVRDATGRRVFAGNGRANSVQTIAGMAPLSVYLGYAGGVQLEVNDRVVAIGPQFVKGDVAHFEAGADGVLRREPRPTPAEGAPARAASPHG